jgi:hypothetical protein
MFEGGRGRSLRTPGQNQVRPSRTAPPCRTVGGNERSRYGSKRVSGPLRVSFVVVVLKYTYLRGGYDFVSKRFLTDDEDK